MLANSVSIDHRPTFPVFVSLDLLNSKLCIQILCFKCTFLSIFLLKKIFIVSLRICVDMYL